MKESIISVLSKANSKKNKLRNISCDSGMSLVYLQLIKGTEVENAWTTIYYENEDEDTYVVAYMSQDTYNKFVLDGESVGRPGETGGMPEAMVDQITEMDNRDIYNWMIEHVEENEYGREGSVYGFWEGKKKIKKETRHEELKDFGNGRKKLKIAIKRGDLDLFLGGRGLYRLGYNIYAPGDSMLDIEPTMGEIYRYYLDEPENRVDLELEKTIFEFLSYNSGRGVYAAVTILRYQLMNA